MAKAKTENKTKIYNKGKRTWPIEWTEDGSKVTVVCNVSRAVEVPESLAARMIKNYPNDFIAGDSLASSSSSNNVKSLKKENASLKKQVADLEAKVAELEGSSSDDSAADSSDDSSSSEGE